MKGCNANLKALFESLATRTGFVPGDFVRWKNGLKNKESPEYGQPVIVTEVFSEPLLDQGPGSGDPYFREPLSIKIAFVYEDRHFIELHVDGRRFEKVPESEL